MPQLQQVDFTPRQRAEETPFEKTLGAFANKFHQNRIDKQDTDQLTKIYDKYRNEGMMIDDAIQNIQTNTMLSPTKRLEATKHFTDLRTHNLELQKNQRLNLEAQTKKAEADAKTAEVKAKTDAERSRIQNSVYELYKDILPEEEARRRSMFDSEATARNVVNKKGGNSQFQKTVETESAKQYVKAKEEIPKLEANLVNLNRINELSQKMRGPGGLVKSISGLSSEASELNNLGLASIEPIIKIFNPVGAIPVAKINIIRDKFAAKAHEPFNKTQGKLSALRRFAQQALDRNEQKVALYEQYEGKIPKDIEKKFDKDSEKIVDQMINTDVNTGEQIPADVPDAKKLKGKIITNPETGERLKSDGVSWSKI